MRDYNESVITSASRMVKKPMRLRARSISGAPRAVHDIELSLHPLGFGSPQGRVTHCPCLDDCARDENAPHTVSEHGGATLLQTGLTAFFAPLDSVSY
jgi:hypothetical protein